MDVTELDTFADLCRIVMPVENATEESRTNPRWLVNFPMLHGPGLATQFGQAANINDDGMCFLTRAHYAMDTILSLELRVLGPPVQIRARVRYSGRGTTGVQFLGLSRVQRLTLLDFCIQRRKRPS